MYQFRELEVICLEISKPDLIKQRLKHNEYNRIWAKNNKPKMARFLRLWRRKRSFFVMNLKKDKCCIVCGESDIACLDFHHRNKADKKYSIQSLAGSTRDNNKVLDEVKKCDVVCANCHRKIHYKEVIAYRKP